ncbi:MAG: redoxin domain-containing protein [Spirochaetota bacterium]
MSRVVHLFVWLLLALVAAGCATAPPSAGTAGQAFPNPDALSAPLTERYRSIEALVEAIENNEELRPEWDSEKGDDQEWQALYHNQYSFYRTRAVKLIGDLAERDPDHPDLEELLLKRFEYATSVWRLDIADEVASYASAYPQNAEGIERACYYLAKVRIEQNYRQASPIVAAVDEFESRYPEGTLLAELYDIAIRYLDELPERDEMMERLLAKFPDSDLARTAEQERKRQESVGRLFDLDFEDRLSGRQVTSAELRGKIVVVDFWATWCGPCVAEIPHMRELYAEWRDRGVEFIGVSLDQDPETVVAFCRENGVEWPQFCEDGRAWDTPLAQQWGINSIPTIFVLDQDGRVHSTNARGRIAQIIRELQ